jgi:hypothetical protein
MSNQPFSNNLLKQYLESSEAECWQGYEILGTYMDILVRMNKKYVAIDLIGFPGPWNTYFELNTYKVIKRVGINVFTLSYALWLKDREVCDEALMSHFE